MIFRIRAVNSAFLKKKEAFLIFAKKKKVSSLMVVSSRGGLRNELYNDTSPHCLVALLKSLSSMSTITASIQNLLFASSG